MNTRWTTTLLMTAMTLCVGCQSSKSPDAQPDSTSSAALSASAESMPEAAPTTHADAGMISGTVLETMDSGGYTYVLVDTGSEELWAAGPKIAVTLGDKVSFDNSMPMTDYFSRTLDRTFERVYFTGSISLDGPSMSAGPRRQVPENLGR